MARNLTEKPEAEGSPAGRPDEAARVEAWRLEQFLDQGWPPQEAEVLEKNGVDHHRTATLLAAGRDFAWVYDFVLP